MAFWLSLEQMDLELSNMLCTFSHISTWYTVRWNICANGWPVCFHKAQVKFYLMLVSSLVHSEATGEGHCVANSAASQGWHVYMQTILEAKIKNQTATLVRLDEQPLLLQCFRGRKKPLCKTHFAVMRLLNTSLHFTVASDILPSAALPQARAPARHHGTEPCW